MKLLDSEVKSMNDEEKLLDNEQEEGQDTATETKEDEESGTPQTFTQDQVNDFVRNRLEKYQSRLYNRYGVNGKNELDELVGKSQSYDVMKEKFEATQNELAQFREENSFIKNNINPEKYEDIRAYFKGKGIEFTNENLINELAAHNEWLTPKQVSDKPTTTIQAIGNLKQESPKFDEREAAKKIFGLKGFSK